MAMFTASVKYWACKPGWSSSLHLRRQGWRDAGDGALVLHKGIVFEVNFGMFVEALRRLLGC